MRTFEQTAVSYKGKDVNGLALPYSVQRIEDSPSPIPKGYVCIGKQQFGRGLRICFISKDLKDWLKENSNIQPRIMKEGEKWISGYKTNLDLELDKENIAQITKECFKKDGSENHKIWMINCAKNNMGLNSFPKLAEKIVNENWY